MGMGENTTDTAISPIVAAIQNQKPHQEKGNSFTALIYVQLNPSIIHVVMISPPSYNKRCPRGYAEKSLL